MSSRTIYALTAGQKPVVITNHFYMRPDIKESLCTQFFFWCILDEKEGPILVDQSFTQRCLDEMKIPFQVKEGPLELLDRFLLSYASFLLSLLHLTFFQLELNNLFLFLFYYILFPFH